MGEEKKVEYWGEDERVKEDNEEKWWRRRNSIQREKNVTNIALKSSSVCEHTAEMWLYISCLLHQPHNHTQSLQLLVYFPACVWWFKSTLRSLKGRWWQLRAISIHFWITANLTHSEFDRQPLCYSVVCQHLLLRASGGVLGIIQQHTYTLKPSSISLSDCKLPSVLSHSQRRHEG